MKKNNKLNIISSRSQAKDKKIKLRENRINRTKMNNENNIGEIEISKNNLKSAGTYLSLDPEEIFEIFRYPNIFASHKHLFLFVCPISFNRPNIIVKQSKHTL